MKGATVIAALALAGLSSTAAQDFTTYPLCPTEGPCSACTQSQMDTDAQWDKIVFEDETCFDGAEHCNMFGMDVSCRGCFTTCEGAKIYVDDITAKGITEEIYFCLEQIDYERDCMGTDAPTEADTPAPTDPPTVEATPAPMYVPTEAPVAPDTVAATEAPVAPVTEAVTPAPVYVATEAPVAPVTEAPVAPDTVAATEAPVAPVTEAVTPAPVYVATEAPVAPVTEAPVAPVTEAPVAPVTEAPVAPVTEAPVAPVTEAPVAPDVTPEGECVVPPACPATEADIMYLGLYEKCITVDTSCTTSTDGAPCHCAMFGLAQDCRGCYMSCEGAMAYLADYPSTPATEFFFCPSSGLTYETCAGGSSTPSGDGIIIGDAPTPAFETVAPIAVGEDGCACDGFGEQCYMDDSCTMGDLGCNVRGMLSCRFCGFGVYADIACP